ncbi:hypothetical protein B0H16DRAFT_1731671 [Mycena metata]|uniref:Uncharacterized protein n=1 Tax=Mycena metata TaxID=1033252 RepID=A0AAD7MVK9_9AGAR|nr:hypothetical protein B0H16DRAFT_1731671 [Mycena metata]
MPKAAKTPVRPRPKPHLLKSPKKVEETLVDDEAIDSDDGVLVDRTVSDAEDGDNVLPATQFGSTDGDLEEGYESDFINDGDPFEDLGAQDGSQRSVSPDIISPPSKSAGDRKKLDVNSSPPGTPSPKRVLRGRLVDTKPPAPSPSKPKRKVLSDTVIDIESTSEEDMAAMDEDNSMFKNPPGVKPSALPPSLTTRSASKVVNKDPASPSDAKKSGKPVRYDLSSLPSYMSTKTTATKGSGLSEAELDAKNRPPSKKIKSASSPRDKGKVKTVDTLSDESDPFLDDNKPSASRLGTGFKPASTLEIHSRRDVVNGKLPSYMPAKKLPPVRGLTGPSESASRGDEAIEVDAQGKEPTPPIDPEPVFLEDIETYKAYFDPEAPCGVANIELQDESLRPHYLGLHPLPSVFPARPSFTFDRNRTSLEDVDWTTGGRVKFSSWFDQNPRMLAANSMGAMLFQSADPNFVNLSRVSPLELSSRVSVGSSQTSRMNVRDRVAVCVSAICCTESHVLAPKRLGTKTDRQRKWIAGVLHDQDWERLESITSLVFGEHIMYAQITDKALSFQTMVSPPDADQTPERVTRSVPSRMFSTRSPGKPSNSTPFKSDKSKTLLAYNDTIPVYDARKIVVGSDLERLADVLPSFPGEVPVGSFTVVGYMCSSYRGTVSGGVHKVAHLSFDILWVIVCGTPGLRSSRS